jgi:hypothetical protein
MSFNDEAGMRSLALACQKRLTFRNACELESAYRRVDLWFRHKESGFKFRAIRDFPMTLEIGHDNDTYVKECIRILKEAGLKFKTTPWIAPKFLNLDMIKYGKQLGMF